MEPINVLQTEFYAKNNAKESHTEEYDLVNNTDAPVPIFRRGCSFYFAIRFDRPFDEEQDIVRVRFAFGPKPNVLKGTRVILPILVHQKHLIKDKARWAVCLTRNDGEMITVQVYIPPSAQVGNWACSLQTNIKGQRDQRNDYKCEEDMYVLFNPWCSEDGVFMEDEAERKEYILNESGKIWCGTFKNPKGRRWIYGQFDDVILPAAVFLLDKSSLAHSDRGNSILVCRAISAVINSVDDAGLLEGRWDGQYGDGTSPHAWTGSTAILDEYMRTGGQPVKYGQCWVFAAATVTVCRALGIPCRATTNYVSAHDTNCSLTVDKYFDIFGDKIEYGPDGDCNDSCWNFHVWNDVWMARPDLPSGYGGWQVIDATPQEQSDNIFRCGPASVEAVRRGEVGYLYDTPFVFSEVNADVCHFQEDDESDWGFSRMSINQYHVGRKIVTKAIDIDDDNGEADMLEITKQFKNKEGTESERLAVYNAVRGVPKAQQYYQIPSKEAEDVFFDLVDIDVVPIGQSIDVIVNIENRSAETRTISAILSAFSVYYTGATAHALKRSQGTFNVEGGGTEVLRITVQPEEYMDKLVDHSLIKIYSIANVQETRQTWSEEDDFTLEKPNVQIHLDGAFEVGAPGAVHFSFTNPLQQPLTECTYTVEGPGLQKPKTEQLRDVEAGEAMTFTETFVARRSGMRKIVVNFNSKEIQGLNGSVTAEIQ